MKVNLRSINITPIISKLNGNELDEFPILIQYADFNVINYFCENNYMHDEVSKFHLYPDSTALYFYIKYFVKKDFKKIISTDLQNNLLSELDNNSSNIYLFGDSDYILQNAIKNIKKNYAKLNIVSSFNGYNFNNDEVISKINESNIDVLFVGLGVGRQEKWILENFKKLNVKVILSVGGWFQLVAENKNRGPLLLRKVHLEWLYKLFTEFPRVWKRYLIGIPIFYFRLFSKKIIIQLDEK